MTTRYFIINPTPNHIKSLTEAQLKMLPSNDPDIIHAEYKGQEYYFTRFGNSHDFTIESWHEIKMKEEETKEVKETKNEV